MPTANGSEATSPFFSSNTLASSSGDVRGGTGLPRSRGALFCTLRPWSRAASSRLFRRRTASDIPASFSSTSARARSLKMVWRIRGFTGSRGATVSSLCSVTRMMW